MPEVPNVYGGQREGKESHQWAADVLLGNCTLEDVPIAHRANISPYITFIENNGYEHIEVEKRWESLTIPDLGGTIDCLLFADMDASRLMICDYKNGTWDKPAENNPQLLCYAAIITEHFSPDQVWGVIAQPNTKRREKIKVAEYTLDEIEAHREEVARVADMDNRIPGNTQCLFCPLLQAGMCEEGRQFARRRGWYYKYKHLKAA